MKAIVCGLTIILFALGCQQTAPPPGYAGPLVSQAGQRLVRDLYERTFTDTAGTFGGGVWTVGGFAVAPYPTPAGKKGPYVTIRKGEEVRYLPMEADGDAIDLYRRVHGQPPADLSGPPSAAYQQTLKNG